jgi:isochorismate hydrolase
LSTELLNVVLGNGCADADSTANKSALKYVLAHIARVVTAKEFAKALGQ